METDELIKQLRKIADDTSHNIRIKRSPSAKNVEKEDADKMISTLSERTVSLFKQNNLLDLIRPDRDKGYDRQWYEETFGNGAVADIKEAIRALEKLNSEEK
ncbi:hypothetical protein EG359_11220 [Chryseobacterium joostei]|uniref:Uncharacterized protein n=1 Tax=Chryseobacterium joostei TaxID=112234 RepID=A0A1N7IGU3_9FLAO|nr:hypothetical protein [Chryseobacterium joostei]AZB00159.1 hypothetical protein EG359_11220 [Chryseobacterium joostei]SIS36295.1 hypothetical protein SAMN05421768_105165 [Chryseobacterium joostei]